MIVVDLGCCKHDGEASTSFLISRHQPTVYWGFDPLLSSNQDLFKDGTELHLRRQVAWTREEVLSLGVGGYTLLNATLLPEKRRAGEWSKEILVQGFDLGAFLDDLDTNPVVKMNIEGAEFPLLEDLLERGLDLKIALLYVAWHADKLGRGYHERQHRLMRELRCPIKPWTLSNALA